MRELINIIEGVGDNFIYHSTPIDSVNKIIYQDFIKSNTDQKGNRLKMPKKYMDKFGNVSGISFTRSYKFAKYWMDSNNAILVLDYNKVRNNFKIIPFSYYNKRDESEEFLAHKKGLHDLNKYLVRIDIPKKLYDYCVETNQDYIEGYKPYDIIIHHPLLNII